MTDYNKLQIAEVLILGAGAAIANFYFKKSFIAVALGLAAVDIAFNLITDKTIQTNPIK